jgi:hypothetical protein
MKKPTFFALYGFYAILWSLVTFLLLVNQPATAQSCPTSGSVKLNSYPNTYYPANQTNLAVGNTSIALGAVTYGSTAISSGDVLLVIQMQGAQLNSLNTSAYGNGTSIASGYLNNANLLAGNMEFVVASNSVPLTGGTVTLTSGLKHAYKNAPYAGNDGQYTYQVIRVPVYYDVQLKNTITAPAWDGAEGGVIVLYAADNIDMNSKTIDASGMGFRGGGGMTLTGGGGGSNTDIVITTGTNFDGSKGEGIAGTPMYTNNNYTSLTVGAVEGYPNGSVARGAPGNAGGGGTDGDPSLNDQNTGGGGGSNGGWGGLGGNAWSSNLATGGNSGAPFAQASASRLVMGGGGGAGTTNNGTGTPSGGLASSGAAGGGIIIAIAENSIINSGTISSNGAAGNTTVQNDGAGGAGGGGSILIFSANGITSNIIAQAKGGSGGSNEVSGGPNHGPGGGGGGGVIFSNGSLAAGSSVSGGLAGKTGGNSTTYGATNGSAGTATTNITVNSIPPLPVVCGILPANFVDVTAQPDNGVINVAWTIANESTTIDYTIERSSDGVNFTAIASTPYKVSNAVDNDYQYTDASGYAVGGSIYYRIRENESGGQFIFSKIVIVRLGSSGGKLSVFPNPAVGSVTVSFAMTAPRAISLRLFDVKGTQVWESQYLASQGQNTLQINKIADLTDGIYLLQWSDGLAPQMVKVLVRH